MWTRFGTRLFFLVSRPRVFPICSIHHSVPGMTPGRMISGIAVHAHIVSQLLGAGLEERRPIDTPSESQEWLWTILWGVLGAGLGAWARSPWRLAVGSAGGLFVLGIMVVVAFDQGWWIPLVPPSLAWALSGSAITIWVLSQERKERALLMHLFSKHVSGEVAEAVWRQREQFLQNGRPRSQQLVATVFFSDFKGYTAASEKMTPEALMELGQCLSGCHGGAGDQTWRCH